MDLVSVVIPYFKKREYIKRCIQSVLRQNYKKFEIIIIYDGEDLSDLAYITNIVKINNILFPPYVFAKDIICNFINCNGHKNKN